jgi:hypothetical protein
MDMSKNGPIIELLEAVDANNRLQGPNQQARWHHSRCFSKKEQ